MTSQIILVYAKILVFTTGGEYGHVYVSDLQLLPGRILRSQLSGILNEENEITCEDVCGTHF